MPVVVLSEPAEASPGVDVSAAAGDSSSQTTGLESSAADTAVVEVQESTATDLKPVGDVTETVAGLPEAFDAQAMERDPDVSPPLGAAGALMPKELQSTVVESDAGDRPTPDRQGERASQAVVPPGTAPVALDSDPSGRPEAAAKTASRFPVRKHTTDDQFVMTYEIGGPSAEVVSTPESGAIDRATVVFIHGWCGNRSQWRSHMDQLAADSIVLSLDLLGHGDSEAQEREEWTIPRFGRDVAGVIEAEDLSGVILVGHAMGGQVALEVALRLPDRIKGIIGVESLHELDVDPVDPEGLEESMASFEKDFPKAFNQLIDSAVHPDTPIPVRAAIRADAEMCDLSVAIKLMRHFQTRDLKSVVRNIECPVRCINSELSKTDVDGNRSLLTGFDATAMADVGYWPHLELPESFQTELVLQIKEILAPSQPRQPAAITGLNPVLFSDDIETLATFYIERLRFEETSRLPLDTDQPASLLILERDDWRLQLQSRASLASDVPGAEDVTQGGRLLFFTVTDLAGERVRLGPDVDMMIPFRTLDSRSQQTIFRDPERNVIVLQQPLRRPASAGE